MKIITISGASGSGKSTLANHIHRQKEGSLLLGIDRYYLSKAEQVERHGFFNFDFPDALDTDLMKMHLMQLKNTGKADVPIYDFKVSMRTGYETVSVKDTIIIDGLFAGSLLSDIADFNIFVDVDLDLALLRRIERDMRERGRTLESVTEQYMKDVRPAYFKHIENIKSSSDFTLKNNTTIDELLKEAEQIFTLLDSNKS
ncbi:MAG: AAA family ATPase [Kordiimonadaceae bacterium]|nr:AAA family ATPase [Kordiimonadaceae bacterium]